MSAELRVNGRDYKGHKLDTIIRREFGQKAYLKRSADPNDPNVGQVVAPAPYGGLKVLGTVSYAYEYTRPKPVSRQQRWDNACARMSYAIDEAQQIYDEVQQETDEDLAADDLTREDVTKEQKQRLVDATNEFANGLSELRDLRDEFQEWEDNLPEAFQYGNSPVSEKLQEIINLYSLDEDVEFELEEDEVTGIDDAQNILDEVEMADLPRGFGRD